MFLIYPYWNVNINGDKLLCLDNNVSNLSILECKLRAPYKNSPQKAGF